MREFRAIAQQCEHVTGQVVRPGHPSEHQWIDFLVKQRRTRGRVRGGQTAAGILSGRYG